MIDLNKICKRTDYIIGRHYVYEGDIIQLYCQTLKIILMTVISFILKNSTHISMLRLLIRMRTILLLKF